jgi:hypothetical protein
MKAFSPVWSALCLALVLVSPNQVHGEAGCFVVEIVMDPRMSLSEPVDPQPSAEREPTSSVHPRRKVKPVKQAPASTSLNDQTRVKAFMSGQNISDYCGDTKIVEGDETGQYRHRK